MQSIGYWSGEKTLVTFDVRQFSGLIAKTRQPLHLVQDANKVCVGLAQGGQLNAFALEGSYPLYGSLPASYPEYLGDRSFQAAHGVRFNYVGGAMARGIASVDLVMALAKQRMLAFFGSAGLSVDQVRQAVTYLDQHLSPGHFPFGVNLIHSPTQPDLEKAMVDLYIKQGVKRVSASAFMGPSKNIVRYACHGLYRDQSGQVQRKHYIFAKISHPSVAAFFMSPPPHNLLEELLKEGVLTQEEVLLAQEIPLAQDITIESDSGGHTDNRPLTALFSVIKQQAYQCELTYHYRQPLRLGIAGGLGTPTALAAAFALGAAYVVVGSVHQSTLESGLSFKGKAMLAKADLTDVMMCSSADMFERGVKVQVLKKGTLMGVRGNQLYELYKRYDSLEAIPKMVKLSLEKKIFGMSLASVWEATQRYFSEVEPLEITKADSDPKYKMALVFRWYLGNTSRWALAEEPNRVMDYQIWCGPAMGAFNTWVKDSFLEPLDKRHVIQIAFNLLEGACYITRAHQLRSLGVPLLPSHFYYQPKLFSL